MELIKRIVQFGGYYLRAQTIYQIHSPVAFALLQHLMIEPQNPKFSELELLRSSLLRSKSKMTRIDFGAGSKSMAGAGELTTGKLAAASISSLNQCRQLYNLCQWQNPDTVLELGTSFGYSASYLQLAQPKAKIITLEGDPSLADQAKSLHSTIFDDGRPEVWQGEFSEILPKLLPKIAKLDLVFLDGNHTYQSTVHYLKLIRPFMSTSGMLIIHDIYWSQEMTKAWEYAKQMPSIKLSIDLFHMGIILFDGDNYQQENLTIVPYWMKPWKIGLFAPSSGD